MIPCAYMRFEHSLRALLRNKYDENGILGCSDPSGSCSASMFHVLESQLMITLVICNTYVRKSWGGQAGQLGNHITAVSLPANPKISHGQVLKIYTFAVMAGPKSVFAHFIVG